MRLNEKNYDLLRILIHLLDTSKDTLVLSVASYDIGEYVRHNPRGKQYVYSAIELPFFFPADFLKNKSIFNTVSSSSWAASNWSCSCSATKTPTCATRLCWPCRS